MNKPPYFFTPKNMKCKCCRRPVAPAAGYVTQAGAAWHLLCWQVRVAVQTPAADPAAAARDCGTCADCGAAMRTDEARIALAGCKCGPRHLVCLAARTNVRRAVFCWREGCGPRDPRAAAAHLHEWMALGGRLRVPHVPVGPGDLGRADLPPLPPPPFVEALLDKGMTAAEIVAEHEGVATPFDTPAKQLARELLDDGHGVRLLPRLQRARLEPEGVAGMGATLALVAPFKGDWKRTAAVLGSVGQPGVATFTEMLLAGMPLAAFTSRTYTTDELQALQFNVPALLAAGGTAADFAAIVGAGAAIKDWCRDYVE
jgi:hypothetical protein